MQPGHVPRTPPEDELPLDPAGAVGRFRLTLNSGLSGAGAGVGTERAEGAAAGGGAAGGDAAWDKSGTAATDEA